MNERTEDLVAVCVAAAVLTACVLVAWWLASVTLEGF